MISKLGDQLWRLLLIFWFILRQYRHLIKLNSCPDGKHCDILLYEGIEIKIQESLALKIIPLNNFHPVENNSGLISWQQNNLYADHSFPDVGPAKSLPTTKLVSLDLEV